MVTKKTNSNRSSWAVIFDMDGVVIDNNHWHMAAWKLFAKRHNIALHEDIFLKYIFGRTLREAIIFLFKKELSPATIKKYAQEKEQIYRCIYQGHVKALAGLRQTLKKLKSAHIPYAMATSAPPANVSFILNTTKLKSYFKIIIDGSDVRHGKPHPEPYIKAAKAIGYKPKRCIVFEDSISGITSAKRAHTIVIGVATTHNAHELHKLRVMDVIKDFRHVAIKTLEELIVHSAGRPKK